MAIDFNVNDTTHKVVVKFTPAFLPNAKKGFYIKPVFRTELDIHGIASKASVYNITVPPKVIEEGLEAGMELIKYLTADGFKIKLPLFAVNLRTPGEYSGIETHLADGLSPDVRMQVTNEFRNYIKEHVTLVIDGIEENNGMIGLIRDEAAGSADSITAGDVLDIYGIGLKTDGTPENAHLTGVWFVTPDGIRQRAKRIITNHPKMLKVLIPADLQGLNYIEVVTQTSVTNPTLFLKYLRTVRSEVAYRTNDGNV
ncbi:hypothetical protein Barb7_00453 [Bacteroidales bacterium Barb7]|nr:hypothetical protein Barb7_00453 [Bacteroidales bacterium Barb7]